MIEVCGQKEFQGCSVLSASLSHDFLEQLIKSSADYGALIIPKSNGSFCVAYHNFSDEQAVLNFWESLPKEEGSVLSLNDVVLGEESFQNVMVFPLQMVDNLAKLILAKKQDVFSQEQKTLTELFLKSWPSLSMTLLKDDVQIKQSIKDATLSYSLFQDLSYPVVVIDEDYKTQFVNEAFCALVLYEPQELHQKSFSQRLYRDDLLPERCFFKESEKNYHDVILVTKDKNKLMKRAYFSHFKNDSKTYCVLSFFAREVQSQSDVFESLINNLFVEQASQAAIVFDQSGMIKSWTPEFLKVWNIDGKLINARSYRSLQKIIAEQVLNKNFCEEDENWLFSTLETSPVEELFLKDGRIVERHSKIIKDDVSGYLGRIWFYRDISFLRQESKFYQVMNERLELAFKATKDGILDWNLKTSHLAISNFFKNLLWIENDSEIKRIEDFKAFIHKEDLSNFEESITGILNRDDGLHGSIMIRLRHKLGHFLWVWVRFLLLRDNDNETPARMIFCVTDINQQKESELSLLNAKKRAEMNERAKIEFLTIMSHEIRTPMNGIMGMIDLLSDSTENDLYRQYLATAKKSCEELMLLLHDTLDFSRIEGGEVVLEENPFSLEELVNSVCMLLLPEAKKKELDLSKTFPVDLPSIMVGDSSRIRQVLQKLIGNALRYTDQGGVRIHVLVRDASDVEFEVKISVSDTGSGISNEIKAKLFSKSLNTLNSGGKLNTVGAGLGLTLVKQVCLLMGGDIECDSKLGVGSTFSFTFKTQKKESSKEKRFATIEEQERSISDFKLRVLVAEDNVMNQIVVGKILGSFNCSFHIVGNGLEALNALDRNIYDLVLMDINMPEMDGLTASKKIRQHSNGVIQKIPIIAVTANNMPGDKERYLEAGMNRYISKPIIVGDLVKAIIEVIPSNFKKHIRSDVDF